MRAVRRPENSWQKTELEGSGVGRSELPDKKDPQELQGPERPLMELPAPLLPEPDVDDENNSLGGASAARRDAIR